MIIAPQDGTQHAPRSLQEASKEVLKSYFFDVHFRLRFWSVLGPILVAFWDPKSSILGSIFARFLDVAPRSLQEAPKSTQEAPTGPKRRPKKPPRGSQETPRDPPKAPRDSQEAPKRRPRRPREAPRGAQDAPGQHKPFGQPPSL